MAPQRRSRIRRFLGFVLFRIVPLLLLLAILAQSVILAQHLARRLTEPAQIQQRQAMFAETVTAIAPTITTFTPVPPTPTDVPSDTPTATITDTASVTPLPTVTETLTAEPSDTPVPTATITNTVAPSPMAANFVLVRQFVTNTPANQNLVFATNTPSGEVAATLTPSVVSTDTPVPIAATTVPPPTESIAIDATPRPLPTVLFLGDPNPDQVDVTAIPARVEPVPRQGYDLMNILLLGTDEEITGDNFRRTDTMIIVSINRTTGSVAMLSLPRDLFVYIPAWGMQRLNLAFARGENGGWNDGPFELIRQTILYNFGINVHYYALIDLSGFTEAIDAVGGVDVAVDCAIQNLPLIGAEVPAAARRVGEEGSYVLDVGEYQLSGAEALWYARARDNSSDFDRGRRQQQILRAVWRKALSSGQITNNLTNLPELWNLASEIVETNLRFEDVVGLVPFALNLSPGMIENFALIRTYHTLPWQPPSGDFVQLPLYDTLRPLLEDFYLPPTDSQIVVEGASIRVLNGTENANWDRVAAGRLGWDGLNAFADGNADSTTYTDTVLIDYTGQTKGSSRNEIASILNVRPENIQINPDANREVDFEVILGSNYNSCTFSVLPIEE